MEKKWVATRNVNLRLGQGEKYITAALTSSDNAYNL